MTTSNAQRVAIVTGSVSTQLTPVGTGTWQAAFPLPSSAFAPGQSSMQAMLTASRRDGTSASIAIPISAAP